MVVLTAALAGGLPGCGGGDGNSKTTSTSDSAGKQQTATPKKQKPSEPLKLSKPERSSQGALKVKVGRSFSSQVDRVVKSASATPVKCGQSTKKNWFVCQTRVGRKFYSYLIKVRSGGSWTATGTLSYTKLTKAEARHPPSPKLPPLHGTVG
jgi:hypothetical protein